MKGALGSMSRLKLETCKLDISISGWLVLKGSPTMRRRVVTDEVQAKRIRLCNLSNKE